MGSGDPVRITADVVEGAIAEVVDAVEALDVQAGTDLASVLTALATLHTDMLTLHADLLTVITKLAGGLPAALQSGRLKVTGLL